MAREFKPQIISANDLISGDVVYLTRAHGWTRTLLDAAIARTPQAAEAMAKAADQPAQVVGPYLLDISETGTGPVPVHFRERFREQGYTGRLRAQGHVLSDQFGYALASGFDEVEIDDALAARQPEAHWTVSDAGRLDYRHRLAQGLPSG